MIRRAFLRRMALAAAACAFIDVPWPKPAGVPLRRDRPALIYRHESLAALDGEEVTETWRWRPAEKVWEYRVRSRDGGVIHESWRPDTPFVVVWQ
jgi:hypothetical protein